MEILGSRTQTELGYFVCVQCIAIYPMEACGDLYAEL